jgi:hypothetical protein
MNLTPPLTKDNFWDATMKQFPKATKEFCQWIDEYKKEVNWDILFCNQTYIKPQSSFIKFHSIPYAMQQGVWIEFVNQNLHHYFEQPEYSYSGDLEEDIKNDFSEIEELIDEEDVEEGYQTTQKSEGGH